MFLDLRKPDLREVLPQERQEVSGSRCSWISGEEHFDSELVVTSRRAVGVLTGDDRGKGDRQDRAEASGVSHLDSPRSLVALACS